MTMTANQTLVWLVFLSLVARSDPPPAPLRYEWRTLFELPGVIFTSATGAGSTLMVSTQDGRIYRRDGSTFAPWADLRAEVDASGEGGLNAIAASASDLYAFGVNRSRRLTLWRMTLSDPNDRSQIWDAGPAGIRHNACVLLWRDCLLFIGIGDQAPENDRDALAALREDSLIGKIVRFHPAARLAEVYASGFRNPWHLDWRDGALWVADVGQQRAEELNRVESGRSYGWPCYEGGTANIYAPETCAATVNTLPALSYGHDGGLRAIVGAAYFGRWLLFDYSGVVLDSTTMTAVSIAPIAPVSGVRQASEGVIVLSFGDGIGRVQLLN